MDDARGSMVFRTLDRASATVTLDVNLQSATTFRSDAAMAISSTVN